MVNIFCVFRIHWRTGDSHDVSGNKKFPKTSCPLGMESRMMKLRKKTVWQLDERKEKEEETDFCNGSDHCADVFTIWGLLFGRECVRHEEN